MYRLVVKKCKTCQRGLMLSVVAHWEQRYNYFSDVSITFRYRWNSYSIILSASCICSNLNIAYQHGGLTQSRDQHFSEMPNDANIDEYEYTLCQICLEREQLQSLQLSVSYTLSEINVTLHYNEWEPLHHWTISTFTWWRIHVYHWILTESVKELQLFQHSILWSGSTFLGECIETENVSWG